MTIAMEPVQSRIPVLWIERVWNPQITVCEGGAVGSRREKRDWIGFRREVCLRDTLLKSTIQRPRL